MDTENWKVADLVKKLQEYPVDSKVGHITLPSDKIIIVVDRKTLDPVCQLGRRAVIL